MLEESRFGAQAILHAYYACFFSAEAALLALGETRSKHSGVIAGFGQFVVKAGGFDSAVAPALRKLFELRNKAVYDEADVDEEIASAAIEEADRFVVAVDAWLKAH
jgi:uncharacterized protein (UPF0332 family)